MNIGNNDLAKLIVRVTCGALLMLHGVHTLFHGLDHIRAMLRQSGLPEFFSYGNIVGEVVAPIFLVLGYKSRIAALIIAVNMSVSVLLAHRDIMFQRNDFGGWMIELNIFYLMSAIAVFFSGAGKYSISRGAGKWD